MLDVAPAEPVPFAAIMETITRAPTDILQLLGITITAEPPLTAPATELAPATAPAPAP